MLLIDPTTPIAPSVTRLQSNRGATGFASAAASRKTAQTGSQRVHLSDSCMLICPSTKLSPAESKKAPQTLEKAQNRVENGAAVQAGGKPQAAALAGDIPEPCRGGRPVAAKPAPYGQHPHHHASHGPPPPRGRAGAVRRPPVSTPLQRKRNGGGGPPEGWWRGRDAGRLGTYAARKTRCKPLKRLKTGSDLAQASGK